MDTSQAQSIQERVIVGLANGRLWTVEGRPVWAGPGVSKPCIVCQLKIHDDQLQYDVLGPAGRSVSVHDKCYQVWRAEAYRLRMKRKSPRAR